ncbi:MAG: hypothetical protein WCW03_01385 [Candidatus Paceibacterota bacterium]|jgi:hypothetical protein
MSISTNIPDQIKKVASSIELSDSIVKIGNRFSLHVDQIGELGAEIRDILFGFSKSSDFVKHVSERLEVNRDLAEKIAIEVNKEVFAVIKAKLQKNESSKDEQDNKDYSPLERAGNMEIIEENEHVDAIPDHMLNAPDGKTEEKPALVKENTGEGKGGRIEEKSIDGVSFSDRYREPVE